MASKNNFWWFKFRIYYFRLKHSNRFAWRTPFRGRAKTNRKMCWTHFLHFFGNILMFTLLYIHEVDQSEVALKSDEVIVSTFTWKNTTERHNNNENSVTNCEQKAFWKMNSAIICRMSRCIPSGLEPVYLPLKQNEFYISCKQQQQ